MDSEKPEYVSSSGTFLNDWTIISIHQDFVSPDAVPQE